MSEKYSAKSVLDRFSHLKGPSVYMMSSFCKISVGMVAGVLVARFVTPRELGSLQTAMLVISYTSFLQLGVFNGLNRHFAFLIGKGDRQRAQAMVNASYRVAHIVGFSQMSIGIIFSLWLYFSSSDAMLFWGSVSIIPVLFLSGYSTHFDTTYRSGQEFQKLGVILFIQSAASLITTILPAVFAYLGLLLRQIFTSVLHYLLRWRYVPVRADGRGAFSDIVELIRIGGPMLISGYIFSLLSIADRSVIAYWKGPEAVGIYALAGIVVLALMIIPGIVGSILYPKAANAYGRTGQPQSIRRFIGLSLLMNSVLTVPVVILGYYFLEPIVNSFLPAYSAGIPAAKVSLLTGVAMSLSGPALVFGTLRRNTFYIIMLGLSTLLVWGAGSWCLSKYDDIIYVAWARAGATFLLSISVIIYALCLTRHTCEFRSGSLVLGDKVPSHCGKLMIVFSKMIGKK